MTCARRVVAAGAIAAVLVALTGCASPQPSTQMGGVVRIDSPAFLHAVRDAASTDGVVAEATDEQLIAAAMRFRFPVEGEAGVTVDDVVVPDRVDVDALVNAAQRYVCS